MNVTSFILLCLLSAVFALSLCLISYIWSSLCCGGYINSGNGGEWGTRDEGHAREGMEMEMEKWRC